MLVRNALFRRVELAAREDYAGLGALEAEVLATVDEHDLDAGDVAQQWLPDDHEAWTADRWAGAMDGYFTEHEDLGTGPDARRNAALCLRGSRDRNSGNRQCGSGAERQQRLLHGFNLIPAKQAAFRRANVPHSPPRINERGCFGRRQTGERGRRPAA